MFVLVYGSATGMTCTETFIGGEIEKGERDLVLVRHEGTLRDDHDSRAHLFVRPT